jgi:hypothetical protein
MINCTKHPQVQASYLCMKCGQWHCMSCMQATAPTPMCRQCAGQSSLLGKQQMAIKPPELWEQINTGGLQPLMFLPMLTGLSAGLAYWWVESLWLVGITFAIGTGTGLWLIHRKRKGQETAVASISDAQVATSLRISKNKLTPQLLAAKTQTSIDAASKKLSDMHIEGKLEIEEENGEIFYSTQHLLG